MKFSIITVCYNAAQTIEATILSVIEQTYPHIEYIVIDGGSDDGTISIINKYREKITYFVSEKDNGIYEAMNKGIAAANGDFISFLNADDYLVNKSVIKNITISIEKFGANKADVFYGDIIIYNPSTGTGNVWKPGRLNKLYLFRGTIPHPATFYNKEVFAKCGRFDTSFKIAGDYEWVIRAYVHYKIVFKHISNVSCIFLEGGLSTNDKASAITIKERKKIIEKYFNMTERIYYPLRVRVKKLFGV